MKQQSIFFLVVGLFSGSMLFAQDYKKTDLGVNAAVANMDVEIQFYNPQTVRIIKHPQGTAFKKESLSVITKAQKTPVDVKQDGNLLIVKSKAVQVNVNQKTGAVSFFDTAGKALLAEKDYGSQFTPTNDAGEKTFIVRQAFRLDDNEAVYGLGIYQRAKMSQRNQKILLRQDNLEDAVPVMQSVKGYGIFWDNYSPTYFNDNTAETSFESEVGDGVDYYFMYGKNADGVIGQMRGLTGQVPMFPLWTYGFWQSRERYESQKQLVDVVKKYRELQVPLDGIIQDWQYWGDNYEWNSMEFLNPEFPNPKKMVDDVHKMNAHLIISIWASFGPKTKPFQVMKDKGMLMDFVTWPPRAVNTWPAKPTDPVSGVKVYDPYNPEARDIYWDYLNKGIFSVGVDGWWMDSTDPDHLDVKESDFDNKTYLGSFRKVRNAFPLMTVGGVYDHQRATTSDKRVFILTRSAFAGQQRYGANTWSGDIVSSWESLAKQIPAGVNFSLTGIPYWNADIGGFFSGSFKGGNQNPEYKELYVRWAQFGAFTPMMRSHGTDTPREIYNFGKKGDWDYNAIEKYINLRYSLLPYIYANAWQVTSSSASMMRALVMDFPQDEKVWDLNTEFMLGNSILVSPVTKSMYCDNGTKKNTFAKTGTQQVYLPKGTGWYDFWTGATHKGGETVTKEVPVDLIPFYVKAGTILPFGPKVQYATEKKWDDLELRIYTGADGEFTLYEDENDNYNYEKGAFATIKFNWNDKAKTLTINDVAGKFPGMLTSRKFNVVLVTPQKGTGNVKSAKTDKSVTYSGKKLTIKL